MVVYIVYGFRWSRVGTLAAPGIRPHIVMNDLLDATSDYIQEPRTAKEVIQSFEQFDPSISSHIPGLALIEQYDPEDTSSSATGQPYAFVCAKVVAIGGGPEPQSNSFLSLDLEEFMSKGPGLSSEASATFSRLREVLAPDEKIRWWLVYNGDPERFYPETDDEIDAIEEESDSDGLEDNIDKRGPPGLSAIYTARQGMVLSFIIVQNRQGKTRLAKWYAPYNDDEKVRLKGEVHRLVAPRDQKYQSNFVEFKRSTKIVYRRYAGLFFCVCVDANDNELAYLEAIHFFVEVLDQFFGNVCELDLVFNFYKDGSYGVVASSESWQGSLLVNMD
ncbi:uncharacterized protein GIQ15_00746 [Arthroderma uncinatum]|uniref:uncharacterized protein n=1 Tax=Arthroderma uncinatum TaxID=74035 RepID=UPI00144A4D7A|nr:uncharacterized protein GIQ15_00746 [Arthroderma uncinatum]KAF3491229.1 hypothetical protein GIQ15_00746 [Arthroderma uncinatum]